MPIYFNTVIYKVVVCYLVSAPLDLKTLIITIVYYSKSLHICKIRYTYFDRTCDMIRNDDSYYIIYCLFIYFDDYLNTVQYTSILFSDEYLK